MVKDNKNIKNNINNQHTTTHKFSQDFSTQQPGSDPT